MNLAYSVERIAYSKKKNFCNFLYAKRYPLSTNIIIFLFIFFSCFLNAQAAPAVSLEELINNAEEYDGKTLTFKGEVIGDIMIRGESAWLNVHDETGAIGVFCPKELVGEIEYQGSYKFRGDVISVKGIFHRFCSEHGGDTDIHAEKITIIEKGEETPHPLDPLKVKASIVLAAIAFALAALHLVVRRFR